MQLNYLSGNEIQKKLILASVQKTEAASGRLFLLGILAGIYISLGGQFFAAALAAGAGKIVGGLVFSTGLILVVLAGAELFTGNMTILTGVLAKKTSLAQMARNWIVVYTGNFLGSVLFAVLVFGTGLGGQAENLTALGAVSVKIANAKMALPFLPAFLRGVACNVLVVLAVIIASGARTALSKIACIVFPITCFVACGFEHSVANMYLIPLGMLNAGESFLTIFASFKNILPVTLGNIAGGLAILLIHPSVLKLRSQNS
jgi:formate/nitrite transporter